MSPLPLLTALALGIQTTGPAELRSLNEIRLAASKKDAPKIAKFLKHEGVRLADPKLKTPEPRPGDLRNPTLSVACLPTAKKGTVWIHVYLWAHQFPQNPDQAAKDIVLWSRQSESPESKAHDVQWTYLRDFTRTWKAAHP